MPNMQLLDNYPDYLRFSDFYHEGHEDHEGFFSIFALTLANLFHVTGVFESELLPTCSHILCQRELSLPGVVNRLA